MWSLSLSSIELLKLLEFPKWQQRESYLLFCWRGDFWTLLGGWLPVEPTMWLEGWKFQSYYPTSTPHPHISTSRKRRGARGWINTSGHEFIIHALVIGLHKNPKGVLVQDGNAWGPWTHPLHKTYQITCRARTIPLEEELRANCNAKDRENGEREYRESQKHGNKGNAYLPHYKLQWEEIVLRDQEQIPWSLGTETKPQLKIQLT